MIENNEEEREAHRKEVEEAAFEAEIASMYRDGVRRSEIERLKDEFAHRNDQQSKNDDVVENIPLDEEVRLENENKNGNAFSHPEPSVLQAKYPTNRRIFFQTVNHLVPDIQLQ